MRTIELLEPRIAPATIYALTESGALLSFDSESPGTLQSVPITGLLAGQSLRGIDFRPATGELYAVAVTTASAANSVAFSYIINPETGVATPLGQSATGIAGIADVPTGFDFNPTADRIRVVNTNDENIRLNPATGTLAQNDTDLTPAATSTIIASAYDRNFTGGSATTLFGINRFDSTLAIQGGINGTPSPNGGVITGLGPLGFTLNAASDGGFDIDSDTGIAYAALTSAADNITRLYTIDLSSGLATAVGVIGNGATGIRGLAVALPDIRIVNPKTASFTDADGDRVTIKVSQGTLTPENFLLGAAANKRGTLTGILLGGPEFDGANLTVSVKKAGSGDGLAHVGFITTSVDLGKVTVKGDVGRIVAGDATVSTPGLDQLNVYSLAAFGLVTQGGHGSVASTISGLLGGLTITDDFGNAPLTAGSVGPVKIRGDFLGFISTTGNVTSLRVGGDVLGGESERGYINCVELGSAFIGGSLIGGHGALSGLLQAQSIGTVHIRGDLIGGSAFATGGISAFATIPEQVARIGSVRIDGNVIGGAGIISGYIDCLAFTTSEGVGSIVIKGSLLGGGDTSGRISVTGPLDRLEIGGDVIGSGSNSGTIFISEDLGRVRIGGDVIGSKSSATGNLSVTGAIGPVQIGGSLVGGGVDGSLSISSSGAIAGQSIKSIKVGGSIIAGSNSGVGTLSQSGSIIATDSIGPITIGQSLIGTATNPVYIVARSSAPPAGTPDVAIASLTVKGDVEYASILAGFNASLAPANADASIGKVKVGGDWRLSNLVAGAQDGITPGFGLGDTLQPGGDPAVIASIASITIKGSVTGSLPTSDHFGFVAEQIGPVKIGGKALSLTDGPGNDNILVRFTDDVRLLEVI